MSTVTEGSKPPRVLACVVCQQRKVKCDRKSPCANCIKSRVPCVPATQVSRRRKRRLPERELLERLRKYEDLLRENNINFEAIHGEKESPLSHMEGGGGGYDSDDEQRRNVGSPSTTGNSERPTDNSERIYETKNFWKALSQEFRGDDTDSDSSGNGNVQDVVFKKAWDKLFENDDHLLFGSRRTAVNTYTLHPEPVQIFRLWQLYLENVNPLLKVTHTPSLQGRIIGAAGNLSNIKPTLEALMFSIYCMAILSLAVDECQAIFGSSQVDLLTRYQLGCQEALLNCGFLRSGDRDCLTALYLYLVSVRPRSAPHSLSSMIGVAIRIAQRMGIHSESSLAKCTALEAEMRRRLWWSLVLFDTRIGEMADFKTATLTPTWDCRAPLNVNDSDFQLEMKEPPQVQGKSTEALFAVVRSEVGDFIRRTTFHLGSTDPALKAAAKDVQSGSVSEASELASLEKTIEDKYLKFCNAENPLHFMTIWAIRGYLAKYRLAEYHSKYSGWSLYEAETQCDSAMLYALSMLECDTKILTSPLTQGFIWLAHVYFPLPAYFQIVQHLKWRPANHQAERAWEVMSDNYQAHFGFLRENDGPFFKSPFFKIFMNSILQAWEAREAIFEESGEVLVTSRIVCSIRYKLAQMAREAHNSEIGREHSTTDIINTNLSIISMPVGFHSHGLFYYMGGQDSYTTTESGMYYDMPGSAPLNGDVNQLDWSAMDWDLVNASTGRTGESLDLTPQY